MFSTLDKAAQQNQMYMHNSILFRFGKLQDYCSANLDHINTIVEVQVLVALNAVCKLFSCFRIAQHFL